MKQFKATILMEEGETEDFKFNTGMRQGDGNAFQYILRWDN